MAQRMMIVLTVCLCAAVVCTGIAAAEGLKIGHIDMQRVFTEYKKTQAAEAKLEEEGKVKTDEREKLVTAIRRMKDEKELLSETGQDEKQAEIDKKIEELKEFDKKARGELFSGREEAVRDIAVDIDAVIDAYGKENGYDLILNKDRRVILFSSGAADLTDHVVESLNKDAKE